MIPFDRETLPQFLCDDFARGAWIFLGGLLVRGGTESICTSLYCLYMYTIQTRNGLQWQDSIKIATERIHCPK